MTSLFDYDEAAAMLKIAPGTLRRYVSERRISFVKVGRQVRFTEENLEDYIQRNTQKVGRWAR